MARNTRTFTDIDLNFIANPATGDVAIKIDENAVKQSLRSLLLTNHYERPFQPKIGSQIRALLFEPYTPLTKAMLEQTIKNTILNHEPRVNLISVQVNATPDNNSLYVTLEFVIKNTTTPLSVSLILDRTR